MRVRRQSLLQLFIAILFLSLAVACATAPMAAAPEPSRTEISITAQSQPFELPAAEEPADEQPAEPEEPAAAFTFVPQDSAPPPPKLTPTPKSLEISPILPLIPLMGGESEEAQPAIPESRHLTLEFPPVMRTGDSMRIRMQLEIDDLGNITPTAIVEGNEVTGEVVEIPDLYDTHYVVAEARLDMAGMEVQPAGIISEPLTRGQSVTFYWSVRPEKSGKYEGTAWLHLRFTPKTGGEESRTPVKALFLEIEAKSFLGFMSGGMARGVGALGSIVGSVLGFPFVDDVAKWLWGRIRRK